MKFELEETLRGASDDEILDDLRKVAKLLGKETLTRSEYDQAGKASAGTIARRFGSWNDGLKKAGLRIKVQRVISDDDFFENLQQMWIALGRQPRYSEVKFPFSRFANVTYDKRFGRYSEALKQFVLWVNFDRAESPLETDEDETSEVPRPQPQSWLRFVEHAAARVKWIGCGLNSLLSQGPCRAAGGAPVEPMYPWFNPSGGLPHGR